MKKIHEAKVANNISWKYVFTRKIHIYKSLYNKAER